MQELRPYDKQGQALELVLYKFDACPFCQRVMRRAAELQVPLRVRDTHAEAGAQDELVRVGGKKQVPCLFINGQPLYESADIVRYLENDVTVR